MVAQTEDFDLAMQILQRVHPSFGNLALV